MGLPSASVGPDFGGTSSEFKMATQQDYETGTAALKTVVQAAIIANVPEWEQSSIPQTLLLQIEQQGAKAVIDAVDAGRAKINQSK
jgi:hypothetical protein